MARKSLLTLGIGERLLASKLQILNGTGSRRPSTALGILTGATPEPAAPLDETAGRRPERQFLARTVYLADSHLHAIDRIIEAWGQSQPRRLNRSAVLRRAVEHLRTLVEAQTPLLLENE